MWLPSLDSQFKPLLEDTNAFEGMTVLITGANRGYGKGAAQNFLAAGATVVLACRSGIPQVRHHMPIGTSLLIYLKIGQELQREMNVGADKVRMFEVDMSNVESVRSLVRTLQDESISLDVVVMNAAMVDTSPNKEKTNNGVGKIARMVGSLVFYIDWHQSYSEVSTSFSNKRYRSTTCPMLFYWKNWLTNKCLTLRLCGKMAGDRR
jgi:hypothetical protein